MRNILLFVVLFATLGCTAKPKPTPPPQLNISVLLDLSDRIVQPLQPSQTERDIANMQCITELFKNDMNKQGAWRAKGKLRVLFHPYPNDPKVNAYAQALNVDLAPMTNSEKKEIYDNLPIIFFKNQKDIYLSTQATKNWIGSDIWRFFKTDVKKHCIEPNHRNILVIMTDGYIYHETSQDRINNRYAYLLSSNIQSFRNNPNWRNSIDSKDFGLISTRRDLGDLEILVLEISPYPKHPNDEEIIEYVLSKWFKEMGVKRYEIFHTDLPSLTKPNIVKFFQ